MTLVLAAGWIAQAVSWLVALAAARGAAAARGEWAREAALRAGVLALVVWTLAAPRGGWPALGEGWSAGCALAFLVGQVVAVVGRRQLGGAWGIGTEPRASAAPAVAHGLYAFLRHPIYACTALACVAQALLARNLPALLLVAGCAVVLPLKIRREERRIGARGRPPP